MSLLAFYVWIVHPTLGFALRPFRALPLHSKAIATQDTSGWETACAASNTGRETCRIGTPFPDNMEGIDETRGDNGWKFNCYVNHKIEDYWVPLLEENLKEHVPELAIRMESAS